MEQGRNHINGCNLHEGKFEEKVNIPYLVCGSGSSAYICQLHKPMYLKKMGKFNIHKLYLNKPEQKEKNIFLDC